MHISRRLTDITSRSDTTRAAIISTSSSQIGRLTGEFQKTDFLDVRQEFCIMNFAILLEMKMGVFFYEAPILR
jgi:hypothetical protein